MTSTKTDTNSTSKIYGMAAAALMCAVTAILSQIAIPMPSGVPVTLQTLAVALCGFILETKYAVASILVYILLGAVGVPVFSGLGAGPAKLFGLTGGFIWGFILFVLLCAIAVNKYKNTAVRIILATAGLLLCHVCGVLQFAFVSESAVWSSFLLVSAPYLIKDFVSLILAYIISGRIRPIVRKKIA